MTLRLIAGTANEALATALATRLGCSLTERTLETFPDGEIHVLLGESVRAGDVYLLQPTAPPVERHLLELLLLADACRRAGAQRITAVMPYFGYARQDRRVGGREAVGARLVIDLLTAAGIDRVVAIDLHNPALEAAFHIPLIHVSAVQLLTEAIRPILPERAVIVAPDIGAARLADRYAGLLNLPVAIVHKIRTGGEAVSVRHISGDVHDRVPIVIDDMISTGGTVEAAIHAAREAGARDGAIIVATHGLLVGTAPERLRQLNPRALFVSDTVRIHSALPLPIQTVSVAPLLAEVISRLHEGRSLADVSGVH
jgi:ribose-phosphate pyrophosphokinase